VAPGRCLPGRRALAHALLPAVLLASSAAVPAAARAGPPGTPAASAAGAGATAAVAPPAAAPPRRPAVASRYAVLVDPGTGQVLWRRNPGVPRAPASLTKMLTAITVKESVPLQARLVVSAAADRTPARHLHLGAGHAITAAQALAALVIISANDMAVVLAVRSAGSLPRFASAMDAQSRRLGLTRSRWRNPHGLDEPRNSASALDLAILARAVLRDPLLSKLARRRDRVVFVTPDGHRHTLWNRGRFLRTYRGAVGVKTGFTDHAGHCLAAAATRGGRTLLAVVLASPDAAADAARLLDWGFGPGRAARSGLRLPAYVPPASVDELLGGTQPRTPGGGAAAAAPGLPVAPAPPSTLTVSAARASGGRPSGVPVAPALLVPLALALVAVAVPLARRRGARARRSARG